MHAPCPPLCMHLGAGYALSPCMHDHSMHLRLRPAGWHSPAPAWPVRDTPRGTHHLGLPLCIAQLLQPVDKPVPIRPPAYFCSLSAGTPSGSAAHMHFLVVGTGRTPAQPLFLHSVLASIHSIQVLASSPCTSAAFCSTVRTTLIWRKRISLPTAHTRADRCSDSMLGMPHALLPFRARPQCPAVVQPSIFTI